MPTSEFFPSLKNLISTDKIPSPLSDLTEGLDTIFEHLYYKDFVFEKASGSSGAFLKINLVTYKSLGIQIPGTNGISLVLNPDLLTGYTEIPISLDYKIEALNYIRNFAIDGFKADGLAFFDLFNRFTNISESDFLTELIAVFIDDPDPIQKFVDDFNTAHAPVTLVKSTDPDEYVVIFDLVTQIEDAEFNIYEVLFTDYIDDIDFDTLYNNLITLFNSYIGSVSSDEILKFLIPQVKASINDFAIALTFPRTYLLPLDGSGEILPEPSKSALSFTIGSLQFSTENGFEFKNESSILFTKSQIGNTGLVLEFTNIRVDLSQTTAIPEISAAGYPTDFVGAYVGEATIGLPAFWIKDETSTAEIKGKNLIIGTGGFSGTIYLSVPEEDSFFKTTLGSGSGFSIEITSFDINFYQSAITSSGIEGRLTIPKFKDNNGETLVLDILAHIGTDGDFSITASEPEGFIFNLLDVLEIKLTSLSIGNEEDRFYVEVAGSLSFIYEIPALGDILPKGIEVKKLRIWDDGSIEFVGGNLILPESFKIKVGPAEFTISSLEYGSYEQFFDGDLRKYNYFGFSGGLGLNPGGVEVTGDGLKFYYTVDDNEILDPHRFLKIDGIGIDLSLPDNDPQLILKGYLYMRDGEAPDEEDLVSGDPTTEYIGGIEFALPKLKLAGTAGMRFNPDIPSFIVDISLELPIPIPLSPTPLGIYGFRGLVGLKYVANREYIGLAEDATWYEYYKKKIPPTDAEGVHIGKFKPQDGFSLGVGASLATTPDEGKTFSSKVFILLSLPEVFLIQGQAGILRKRLLLDSEEDPPFSAMLSVSDESIEAAFGINYNLPVETGNIAKVNALIEVAFFFTNSSAWYVNIGRDLPEEKRVSARLLTLFDAYFYFMVSKTGIRTGAGVSFELDKKFGPVAVEAGLYFDVAGKIAFKPVQVGGSIAVGGYFRLVVFGFKFGLSASASLSAEAPKPFIVTGTLTISLELPWPFDNIGVDIEFTWVFNSEIDTTEIAAFSQESTTTAESIKSTNILTGETFAIKYIVDWEDTDILTSGDIDDLDANYVIPMDAYINFELAKSVDAYDTSLNKIGGISQYPEFTEFISPQKAKSDRARHEFRIDELNIYCWNPDEETWDAFVMSEANTPLKTLPLVDLDALENLKDGYWQMYEPGKYNKISLLSRDPLSYLSATTGDVIPEEMGITTETIFCGSEPAPDICITFTTEETWDGTGIVPGETTINHKGLIFYLSNSEGTIVTNTLCDCMTEGEALSIEGGDTLEIIFPISAPKITFCLGTETSGITLEFYKRITEEIPLATGLPSIIFDLVFTKNLTLTELESSYTYEDVENSIDKVILKSGTCSASGNFTLTSEGSQYLIFLHTLATSNHLTSTSQLYSALDTTFNGKFQNSVLYPYIAANLTITYTVLTSNVSSSSILQAITTDNYGYSCGLTLQTVSGSPTNFGSITGFTNLRPDPAFDTGGLIYNFLVTGQIGSSSSIELKGSSCYPIGTINQGACTTQICKICYQDYPTYIYNEGIIEEAALDADIGSMIEGLNGTLQPIWRPDTIYAVSLKTSDNVFINEDFSPVEMYSNSYTFQFRTKGPIGHFHQHRVEYANLSDKKRQDEFKLQSLKYYVDFSKSYPNADGNILNAKPLYYLNPKLLLFYINGYVYQMFSNWEAYNGNPEVEQSLEVIIKDPVKLVADESEKKVLGIDNWKKNNKPITTIDIEILENLIENGDPCADLPAPLEPLDVYSEVPFESLKPLKLYTAIWNSIYNEDKMEVLKYGFQTSRYSNFEEHINSYILSAEVGSETYAIFNLNETLIAGQIDLVKDVLDGTMAETDSLIQQFPEKYDRIVDGILKIGAIAPAVTTEFNIIRDLTTNTIVALIIRSPEPFNDPKTPIEILNDALNITIEADDPSNYITVYSKDKTKVFISTLLAELDAGNVSIDFKYLLFNGIEYAEVDTVNVSFEID